MIEKGRRVTGEARQALAKDLVERYAAGENIRALAASTGRSYGTVHNILAEAGVVFRRWGGDNRAVASGAQLLATLAVRHPGERLTQKQALATLRAVHGKCAKHRADLARKLHNELLTQDGRP